MINHKTALVTGANRGIGLELTRQLLGLGYMVIATCRNPEQATALQDLKKQDRPIEIYRLDVANENDLSELVTVLSSRPIDRLILNAGIAGEGGVTIGNIHQDNLKRVFEINAIAPIKIAEQLLDAVSASQEQLIIAISSQMGSISDNSSGRSYAYRGSKAALNAMMKSFSIDAQDRAKVLLLHPGWVRTDMGGQAAAIDVETSVKGLLDLMQDADHYATGSFMNYQGKVLPW